MMFTLPMAETPRSVVEDGLAGSTGFFIKCNESTGLDVADTIGTATFTNNTIAGTNVADEVWDNAGWFTPSSVSDNYLRFEQDFDDIMRLDDIPNGGLLLAFDFKATAGAFSAMFSYGKPLGGSTTLGGYYLAYQGTAKPRFFLFMQDGTDMGNMTATNAIAADGSRHSVVLYLDIANLMAYMYLDGLLSNGLSFAIPATGGLPGISNKAEGNFGGALFGKANSSTADTLLTTNMSMKRFLALKSTTDISALVPGIAAEHYAQEGELPWGLEDV